MKTLIETIQSLETVLHEQGMIVAGSVPEYHLEGIKKVEAQLNFTFPRDYIDFIATYGYFGCRFLKMDRTMCAMLWPFEIAEDMEFVFDQEGEWSGNIVIFQKFDHDDRFDFYAFRRNGDTVDIVSYFDDGGTVRPVASSFTEHMELLVKSMADGSYRNKYSIDQPYDKAAFDVAEQKQADRSAMLATFQEAGVYLKDRNDKVKLLKALDLYDQTIAYFLTGKVVDDHFLLAANDLKRWAYSYLVAYCRQDFTATEMLALQQALIAQARHTLSLVPADTNNPSYKDILRGAGNSLAWYMAATTEQRDVLENALAIAEQAVTHIETTEHYFIYDTQVRILFQLNRMEEAYQVVKRTLDVLPDFSDFQDIKNDAGYIFWLKTN